MIVTDEVKRATFIPRYTDNVTIKNTLINQVMIIIYVYTNTCCMVCQNT